MLYKLHNSELEQIARIYEVDVDILAEQLDFEDEILSFQPFEHGLKIQTTTQRLTLRLKDRPLDMGGN